MKVIYRDKKTGDIVRSYICDICGSPIGRIDVSKLRRIGILSERMDRMCCRCGKEIKKNDV
jgi:hypothetical protein